VSAGSQCDCSRRWIRQVCPGKLVYMYILHGRDAERELITTLIDEAWASRGGALVIRGEPGVGKSALLADALERTEGMQVLRTQGIECESPLAFAALHRLLRPIAHHVPALPGPQQRAVRAAFGEEEGVSADRFLVFLGVLNLLTEAAESAPVFAAIDDAQWLDDDSAAALLFVARRLGRERVALVFAVREGDVRTFDSGELPNLVVRGLNRDAVDAMLAERTGAPVAPHVCDWLMERTGGNPLALVELPDVLSRDQLLGAAHMPDPLPLTQGVERVFLDRYRRLPEQAQTVLLVAAADHSPLTVVRAAAARLGADDEGFDVAERSGLLRVQNGHVELHHPLVRSAVYNAATTALRRRVHQALAEVLTTKGDADRRAWHLADAADEPDALVVRELEAVAERASLRGGLEAASAAWERAAELTTDPQLRAERLYAAGRQAWLAGQSKRARLLIEAAQRDTLQPGLRADIARLRARIEWNTGSATTAHRMILEAAAAIAPVDSHRAREMATFAVAVAAFGNDSGVQIDPLCLVPEPSPADPPRVKCFAALLVGLHQAVQHNWAAAAPALQNAFMIAESLGPADQDMLPNLGIAALQLCDDERAQRYHNLLLTRAQNTGAVLMVRYSLSRLAFSQIATGQWATASAGVDAAITLARRTGEPALAGQPLAFRALLSAYRDDPDYQSHLREIEQTIATSPLGILQELIKDVVRWAKAVKAGIRDESAFHHLEQMTHHITRGMAAVDRLEAAVHGGRPDAAIADIADLETFATTTRASWAAAAAAHGRALLSDGDDADGRFIEALEHHEASPRRLDRARTELAYGEYLRRRRRRVDARTHLRAALQAFSDVGAARWEERAGQELRASGETTRRRAPSGVTQLTHQELQVAQLVAQGLSNREAAARLFVSQRTVEFHLRHVYAKLGISSRTELARLKLD
jgi:DNA-binding CsgD family transcriptional regulator